MYVVFHINQNGGDEIDTFFVYCSIVCNGNEY